MEPTNQVPIDTVSVDQLPRETSISYTEICLVVGSLYIDTHHRLKTMEEQYKSINNILQDKLQSLIEENNMLKQELNKHADTGSKTQDSDDEDSLG